MKKNKLIVITVLAGAIFLQIAAFCSTPKIYYEYGFAIGISNTVKNFDVGFSLIYIMFPIMFILFFMSNSIYDLVHGYGKVLIIRNYAKTKLILKQYFRNTISLMVIVLFQCAAFFFFNKLLLPVESGLPQSIVMYFVVLHAVILLQCLLELFMPAQNANIILFIYCFVSYYVAQVATENVIAKIILFPSLMFGMQNGATDGNNVYYLYLAACIIINLSLAALGIRKFKRTDIF